MTDQTTRTHRFVRALKARAWLWLLPTLIGLGGAAIWSAWTPHLYRSSALISLEPSRVPATMVTASANTQGLGDRIPAIRNEILSRTRLERIIQDLDLYATERQASIMQEVVEKMRSAIEIRFEGNNAIAIGFTSTDPRAAQRVADRLSALFLDESRRDRRLQVENTEQFLESQLAEMKVRIEKAEEGLAQAEARGGPRGSLAAETLELEVAKEGYKKLLIQRQDASTMANLERREIGEQYRLVDPARIPEAPLGPARWLVILVATLCGLGVGLILVALSSARAERPLAAVAEPA